MRFGSNGSPGVDDFSLFGVRDPVIQGTVSGSCRANTALNLTGSTTATATTISTGAYVISGIYQGNYTLTPAQTDCIFSPTSATFTSLTTDQTSNFTSTLSSAQQNIHIHSGTITQPTSAVGSVTYTGITDEGSNFTPSIILLAIYRGTSADTGGNSATAHPTYAFCTTTASENIFSESFFLDIGGPATSAFRYTTLSKCISYHNASGTETVAATLASTASGSFTLNWTTADASPRIIYYWAIGGSGIGNIKVGSTTFATSQTTASVSLGWRPSVVFFVGAAPALAFTTHADQYFCAAAADTTSSTPPVSSGCMSLQSQGSISTPAVTHSYQLANSLTVMNPVSSGLHLNGSMAINSTGFSLSVVNTQVSGSIIVPYIAIQGGRWNVQAVQQPTTGTNQPMDVPIGWRPKGAIVMSANQPFSTTALTGFRTSLGFTDFQSMFNVSGAAADATASGAHNASSHADATNLLTFLTEGHATPVINGSITSVSPYPTGLTLNVDTTDGTSREVVVISVGATPTVTTTHSRPRLIL